MFYRQLLALIGITMSVIAASKANNIDVFATEDHGCYAMVGEKRYRCSLGANGVSAHKIEGDKSTPLGSYPLRQLFYRASRVNKNLLKNISLPIHALTPQDGWCDDPKSKDYNTFIDISTFDNNFSYEKLYREDDVYNLILVVGYNDKPVKKGKGSAIFIHVARENYPPTDGCIAFAEIDLLDILGQITNDTKVTIQQVNSSQE